MTPPGKYECKRFFCDVYTHLWLAALGENATKLMNRTCRHESARSYRRKDICAIADLYIASVFIKVVSSRFLSKTRQLHCELNVEKLQHHGCWADWLDFRSCDRVFTGYMYRTLVVTTNGLLVHRRR